MKVKTILLFTVIILLAVSVLIISRSQINTEYLSIIKLLTTFITFFLIWLLLNTENKKAIKNKTEIERLKKIKVKNDKIIESIIKINKKKKVVN